MTSSSSRPVTPGPADRADAPMTAAAADRISPLRVALWAAIAVVLATGVILYFRHQDEVAPVLGVASGVEAPR